MRCDKCGRNMVKVDRREEMTDLDDDATDGQIADFFAAEMSGDAGAWSVGVIEYHCARCDAYHQIQEDELTNYKSLIGAGTKRPQSKEIISLDLYSSTWPSLPI